MRPAPDNLTRSEFDQVFGLYFRQEDDVALGDQLLAGGDPADEVGQLVVGGAEVRSVAVLEKDALADLSVYPAEVRRVKRQPALVRLARAGQDTK
jgi:hypothetical protein